MYVCVCVCFPVRGIVHSYFTRGVNTVDNKYSSVRVAAAAVAGLKEGTRLARTLGVEVPTQEVVARAARTAAKLVSLRPGPSENRAALRIQALVRGSFARSSAKRQKAAKLRFAKLAVFPFVQAIVDVWEGARMACEERLVSMFMYANGTSVQHWLFCAAPLTSFAVCALVVTTFADLIRLGDKNDDGVLDFPEFEPLAREFAQQVGCEKLSDTRIRALFLKMVAEDATGAISMNVFVANMARTLLAASGGGCGAKPLPLRAVLLVSFFSLSVTEQTLN